MVDDVAKHCVYNTDLGLVVDFLFVVLWLYIYRRKIHTPKGYCGGAGNSWDEQLPV